jgi:acetylglutamate synthase
VAILEPSPVAPYLSKFAVEPVAQGEGIGQDLWQAITRQYRSLVWRSRPANPIRSWYANVCHGMLRLADWHVFWRGLEPEQVAGAVVEARSRPNDFYDARCPNP